MKAMSIIASRLTLGMLFAVGAPACQDADKAPALTPGPPGELPVEIRAMIYGDETPCRDGEDCLTGQCLFGRCSGLVRTDEQWRTELVASKLKALVGDDVALRRAVIDELSGLTMSEDLSLPSRARLIWALEAVAGADGLSAPAAAFDTLAESLQELVAIGMTRYGDARFVDRAMVLTESPRPAVAISAIRSLGGASAHATEALLAHLLAILTGEVPHEMARAALDALTQLKDPRTIRALIAFGAEGVDALREPTAIALEAMTGAHHATNTEAWRAWADANKVPPSVSFTPTSVRTEDDIGLPEP